MTETLFHVLLSDVPPHLENAFLKSTTETLPGMTKFPGDAWEYASVA